MVKLKIPVWLWLGGTAGLAIWWWRREKPFDDHYTEPQLYQLSTSQMSAIQRVVPEGSLSGHYGTQRTRTHIHRGIDIAAPEGAEVLAPSAGVVFGVWPDCNRKGYGNNVLVQHHDGHLTFYAHLNDYQVTAGQRLATGDLIGHVGSTRCGLKRVYMAPHLHMEVHTAWAGSSSRPTINETTPQRVDPLEYLERLWHGDVTAV